MEKLKKEVLEQWLKIEFYHVANKANLIPVQKNADEELIYNTIRCLDYETIMKSLPSANYIITVIGLMWEHTNHSKYDLKLVIVKFLSRIGYPTSAIICDKGFDNYVVLRIWVAGLMKF